MIITGGEAVPLSITALTNTLVYSVDTVVELHRIGTLLSQNPKLEIYGHVLVIDTFLRRHELIQDWSRLHIKHIVIQITPDTFESAFPNESEFRAWCSTLKQTGAILYCRLENGQPSIDLRLVHGAGIKYFVTDTDPDELDPYDFNHIIGVEILFLPKIIARRADWLRSVMSHLEARPPPAKSYKRSEEPTAEEKDSPDGVYVNPRMTGLMQSILALPARYTTTREQPYHKYAAVVENLDSWLRFLNHEHPGFCAFVGDMFTFHIHSVTKAVVLRTSSRLYERIRACRKRFLVGLMGIKKAVNEHSNAIIVDFKDMTMARFEPHGKNSNFYDNRQLDGLLSDVLQNLEREHGVSLAYVPPAAFCRAIGPQKKADTKMHHDFETEDENRKDRGWCAILSLMFVHYRLANPQSSRIEVERMMSNKDGGVLANEIRSYANANMRVQPTSARHVSAHFTTTVTQHRTAVSTAVSASMQFNKYYPKTDFFLAAWSTRGLAHTDLIAASGEVKDDRFNVTSLRIKYHDIQTPSDPRDAEVLANAEGVFWCDLLRTLFWVRSVQMIVGWKHVPPLVRSDLIRQANTMTIEELQGDLQRTLPSSELERMNRGHSLEDMQRQWTIVKAIMRTAETLTRSSLFSVASYAYDKIVLQASRDTLLGRCDTDVLRPEELGVVHFNARDGEFDTTLSIKDQDEVEATMTMNEHHSRTDFFLKEWGGNRQAHGQLVIMKGLIEQDVLNVSDLHIKHRQQPTQSLLDEQELEKLNKTVGIFWCNVCRLLPWVQHVHLTIKPSNTSSVNTQQFFSESENMTTDELRADIERTLGEIESKRLFAYTAKHGHLDPVTHRVLWAQMNSSTQAAAALRDDGFVLEKRFFNKMVLRASRADLLSRCEKL